MPERENESFKKYFPLKKIFFLHTVAGAVLDTSGVKGRRFDPVLATLGVPTICLLHGNSPLQQRKKK